MKITTKFRVFNCFIKKAFLFNGTPSADFKNETSTIYLTINMPLNLNVVLKTLLAACQYNQIRYFVCVCVCVN